MISNKKSIKASIFAVPKTNMGVLINNYLPEEIINILRFEKDMITVPAVNL
jgi:hypothetical protein